jgi:hypothetical protein
VGLWHGSAAKVEHRIDRCGLRGDDLRKKLPLNLMFDGDIRFLVFVAYTCAL